MYPLFVSVDFGMCLGRYLDPDRFLVYCCGDANVDTCTTVTTTTTTRTIDNDGGRHGKRERAP